MRRSVNSKTSTFTKRLSRAVPWVASTAAAVGVLGLTPLRPFEFAAGAFASHSATRTISAVPTNLKNWGLSNQQAKSHINAPEAWKIQEGSRDVVVAVIDTGIDPFHPDLHDNIWVEKDEEANQLYARKLARGKSAEKSAAEKLSLAHSPVGCAMNQDYPNIYGWNFVTNEPNPRDDHGHGTHVAGIIGAVANPVTGMSGVAHKVSIMPVKYFANSNPGSVNLDNTVKSLYYAINHGAQIINYSGGGPEFSQAEHDAIAEAERRGILVVAAAGNERQNIDEPDREGRKTKAYFPSSYGMSNIISVAATDIQNKLLKSSNWGKQTVDVAAPGENIFSTLPCGKYGYMTGTSQATAFVSGVAALLLAQDPTLKPAEIKKIIRNSVDPLPELAGLISTGGRVNAYAALMELKSRNYRLPTPPVSPDSSGSKTRVLATRPNAAVAPVAAVLAEPAVVR